MFRVGTISMVSVILIVSSVFAQQTITIGEFEFTPGGDFRTVYESYTHREEPEGLIFSDQDVDIDVARFNLTGKYGNILSAYVELGYPSNWLYLGYVDINLGRFTISSGFDFLPTGIEPSTRDVDLHFIHRSTAAYELTPFREPGVEFIMNPIFGEKDFISISLGLYEQFSVPTMNDFYIHGEDRRILLDLPYLVSLSSRPIDLVEISGYYGRDIKWWEIREGDEWSERDCNVLTCYGLNAGFDIADIGFDIEYFYTHYIQRGVYWWDRENYAAHGGQMSIYYRMPETGFLSLEPAFRIDIYDPDKHAEFDRTTTWTYGLNMYMIDDHLRLMLDYVHPAEELEEEADRKPVVNDRFLASLQITM